MAGAKLQQRLLQQEMSAYSLEATKSAISQSQLNAEQIKAILSSKGLEGQTLETTTAELAQTTANNANATSQDIATASTGRFSLALKGLTSSISTVQLALLGVTALLGIFYVGVNAYQRSQEELRQSTEEAANAYKETSSSISDYVSKYKELNDNKNITTV